MEESLFNVVTFIIISVTIIAVFAVISIPLFAPQGFGPNPVFRSNRCTDYCPSRVCQQYQDRVNNYNSCLDCQKQGMCYSEPSGSCFKCSESEANIPCKSQQRYGCENPRGFQKHDVPPINPMINGCQLCWK